MAHSIMIKKTIGIAFWTIVLLAAMYFVDRGLFGPMMKSGWIEANALSDIPSSVGAIAIPAYLPKDISWPPRRIFYQTKPLSGWWIEIRSQSQASVWIGNANKAYPDAMKNISGCFETFSQCPEGWKLFSFHTRKNIELFLITNIEPVETTRIVSGLQL